MLASFSLVGVYCIYLNNCIYICTYICICNLVYMSLGAKTLIPSDNKREYLVKGLQQHGFLDLGI